MGLEEEDWTDRAEVAWAEFATGLIGLFAGVIEDAQSLAAFEGGLAVTQSNVENLVTTLQDVAGWILAAIGTVTSDFQAEEGSIDVLKAAWLNFSAGLISTVSGIITDMQALADFEGELVVAQGTVENLVQQLNTVASTILAALGEAAPPDIAEDSLNALKARWLDFASSIVGTVTDAISSLVILTKLEADWTVPLDAVDNLVQQLDTVARQILAALGEAVPDVAAEGALELIQAAWAEFASGLVGAIAGAIDSLAAIGDYVSVSNITAAVERLVADLQSAVDTITTELAGVSWTEANVVAATWVENAAVLLGHIGDVVSSMESIGDYEAESLVDELRLLIRNLTQAVTHITENFPTVTIPEGLLASTQNANTILGHIQTIAEAIAHIGELEMPSTAFRNRLFAISNAMQRIADLDMSPFQLAVDNAGQLLVDVQAVVQSIKDIISTLSNLGELSFELPNLQEVGTQLVGAFAGGFVQATSTVADGMFSAVAALIQAVQGYAQSFSELFTGTGWNLGSSLIQGMIDGLLGNTSALYQTIADIVANAIAVARAAAGVASPSKRMAELGGMMRMGLMQGLQAGQAELAGAMAGMMSNTMAPAMAYAAPAGPGAAGGPGGLGSAAEMRQFASILADELSKRDGGSVSYAYNEAPGVGADTRASLRQNFEAMALHKRLNG